MNKIEIVSNGVCYVVCTSQHAHAECCPSLTNMGLGLVRYVGDNDPGHEKLSEYKTQKVAAIIITEFAYDEITITKL